jgi:hypothetical protein
MMFGLSYGEWMMFWGTATEERKQERRRTLRMCMHDREERLGNAREEKMSLCEWLEEPAGFRLAACRVQTDNGQFLYEEEF